MANVKFTGLASITGANVAPATDILPMVDVSVPVAKKITFNELGIAIKADILYGTWNATTNSPTLASGAGNAGEYYQVGTGGTTTLDGISTWVAGDIAWFDGTAWQRQVGVTGLDALYLQIANDLSDLNSASTARSNLGLGTAATHATGDYLASGGNGVATADITAAAVTAPKLAVGIYRTGVSFDGGGSAITTGQSVPVVVGAAGTIVAVYVVADQSTTTVIDIWKTNAAIPTVSNTITASAKPTLTTADYLKDTTFTGWTTSVAANDVLIFNVDSNDNATQLSIIVVIG